ncbi:MAG TPA: aspartate dehydrogenase [Candidatus Thermoplasmatota archaeon]|nr:aspartate dehydrogenase [Candidatus Thermoplasmatota archaeon]
MDLLLVGCGAIGSEIARAAQRMPEVGRIALYDVRRDAAEKLARQLEKGYAVATLEDGIREATLVVEAASQEAVRQVAALALDAGRDVMLLSVSALADDALVRSLTDLARRRGRNIYVPSGAIGAIDALKAARVGRLQSVTLTTTKPPAALGLNGLEQAKVVYEGPADEAMRLFPKNVNIAASLALAGLGAEQTRVRIVADPRVARNTHELRVEGDFGLLTLKVENEPSPHNPATSHLASLSAIALLHQIVHPLQLGT